MQYRDHHTSTRERIVTREVMKLELRQARQRAGLLQGATAGVVRVTTRSQPRPR
jgi:hypothetical protein